MVVWFSQVLCEAADPLFKTVYKQSNIHFSQENKWFDEECCLARNKYK